MGRSRGVARAARGTRRSSRRIFPGSPDSGEARRRDRGRGSEGRLPFGSSIAARVGGLRPQTVITDEILAPRARIRGGPRCLISPPVTLPVTPPLRWGGIVGSMSKSPRAAKEVLPLEASREPTPEDRRGQAYWCGWIDGRFGRCRMPHRELDEIFG